MRLATATGDLWRFQHQGPALPDQGIDRMRRAHSLRHLRVHLVVTGPATRCVGPPIMFRIGPAVVRQPAEFLRMELDSTGAIKIVPTRERTEGQGPGGEGGRAAQPLTE